MKKKSSYFFKLKKRAAFKTHRTTWDKKTKATL